MESKNEKKSTSDEVSDETANEALSLEKHGMLIFPNGDDKNQSSNETKVNDSEKEDQLQYLVFEKDKQSYAIPTDQVAEITRKRKIYKLPIRKGKIIGIMALRGNFIPVFNTKEILSNKSLKDEYLSSNEGCIIICSLQKSQFGLPVDKAVQTVTLKEGQIEPMKNTKGLSTNKINCVKEVCITGEGTHLILNLSKLKELAG